MDTSGLHRQRTPKKNTYSVIVFISADRARGIPLLNIAVVFCIERLSIYSVHGIS